jgi:hypothetical protein
MVQAGREKVERDFNLHTLNQNLLAALEMSGRGVPGSYATS